ncbi:hypothetical protein [Bounagaea algeriensis]
MRRSRTGAAAVFAGAALLLSACANEAGPTATQQPAQEISLANVAHKVELVQHDPCYERPVQHGPTNCERYLVEVRNIAGSAADSPVASPEVRSAARDLGGAVQTLYDDQCLPPSPEDEQTCNEDLAAIARAMDGLAEVLPR